ncbi:ABC transporter ATP-binding protein [Leucobacter viscericola]|uniref:ABC transporter ATP-binding protein n=1 Tax=Leucobacter viscericola TaxID=2714935 RepID=A0A6G7XI06_9MICO|nr:ABC transporter ATP-binding protein [Leucobacter viscericola]QIK64195.1 ABC transporter ATP-binding protein [Leucobacter viscericola]
MITKTTTTATDPEIAGEAPVLLSLRDVTKTYQARGRDVQALKGIDLNISAGDFITIQGPTGGGKSTLLQLLGALDSPSSGSLWVGQTDLAKAGVKEATRIRAEEIGFVFQSFNLIPTLTALENVEMGLVPIGVPAAERRSRAEEALRGVGLGDRGDHRPGELSGGQQQRVAIARAIVKGPRILLADEPTGNLDERMRDEILEVLTGLNRDGLTMVLVTHDSAVAKRASRRLRLEAGKITEL